MTKLFLLFPAIAARDHQHLPRQHTLPGGRAKGSAWHGAIDPLLRPDKRWVHRTLSPAHSAPLGRQCICFCCRCCCCILLLHLRLRLRSCLAARAGVQVCGDHTLCGADHWVCDGCEQSAGAFLALSLPGGHIEIPLCSGESPNGATRAFVWRSQGAALKEQWLSNCAPLP